MSAALSILDLVPVPSGTPASAAVRASTELAQTAEQCGYTRYWIAEHHSIPSIASSAPEVLLTHAAAATEHIRVGSGGIMLPNHAPLRVAEVFHTLTALYQERIDLGLGRAPGTNPRASRALRAASGERFNDLLEEMLGLSRAALAPDHPYHGVSVMPNDVGLPPIWILGSSGASAHNAGSAGMGYSFASHFSPVPPEPALRRYRGAFQPSAAFPEPHAILGVSVICAPTDAEAEHLAATVDLAWLRLRKGEFYPLPSPDEAQAYSYTDLEYEAIRENRHHHVIGSPDSVRAQLEALETQAEPDEFMIVSNIHDHSKRLRSYELVAEIMR